MAELYYFNHYQYNQLVAMGNAYYAGKANEFQIERYEQIRYGLLDELRSMYPQVQDTGTAAYIHAAIAAHLEEKARKEKEVLDGMRANMQTAHNNLKNWN